MPDRLSPKIEDRIRALCRQLAAQHRLDRTQRRVLQSRIEAHLREYVSGERKLTEDEAFILVREHFGTPQRISGYLQEVYAVEVQASLVRKTGIIVAASLGAKILLFVLLSLYLWPIYYRIQYPVPNWIKMGELIPIILIEFGAAAIFWRLLAHIKKAREGGLVHRLYSVSPITITAILLILSGAFILSYQAFATVTHHSHSGPIQTGPTLLQYFQQFLVFLVASFSEYLWPLVWFWWFGASFRHPWKILYSVGVWFLYSAIFETTLTHLISHANAYGVMWNIKDSMRIDWKIGVIAILMYCSGTYIQCIARSKFASIAARS